MQVIAKFGIRTPLADHAVDGGVGSRKGGSVRQAAVAAHLGLVGRLRRLGRGRGGHDIALVVRFQRGARIDRLQLLLTEILGPWRSEEHTSELQSLMRTSYAVFCLEIKIHTPDGVYHAC